MQNAAPRKRIVDDLDFWRDEEGQAATEFVIVTPIVLFVILSIIFTFDHQTFKQDAIIEARNATWQQVVNDARTGGQRDSDEMPTPLAALSQIGINLGGLNTIRNAMRIGSFIYPDTLSGGLSAEAVIAGAMLFSPFNNFSIFGTASLDLRNYFLNSGPAFRHTSPWNRTLFAIGNFQDTVGRGTASAGAWPPAQFIEYPNEHYPLVNHCWEAFRQNNCTWDEAYNEMQRHITGREADNVFEAITETISNPGILFKGLEVSCQATGFAGFELWNVVTLGRSAVFKFNKNNFRFNADRESNALNLGDMGLFDLGGAPQFNTEHPDDAHNRITAITGKNRVQNVTK